MFIRQLLKAIRMAPLKIQNGGNYELLEYLTCRKFGVFHAITACCCTLI